MASFKCVSYDIGQDCHRVYAKGRPTEVRDFTALREVGVLYVDEEHVYTREMQQVPGADPKTLHSIYECWMVDANHVYWYGQPLPDVDVKTFENYKANYAKWLANQRSGHPLTLDAFLAENCITERVWRNTLIAISFISLNVSVQKSTGDDEDELSQDELLTVSRENVDLLQEVQDEIDRAIGEYVPDRNETHHITDANEIFIIRAALTKSISELTPRQKRVFLKTIGFDEIEWRFDDDLELSMKELADTCTFPSANAASKYFNTVRQILIDKLTAKGITANGVERKIKPVKIKETA